MLAFKRIRFAIKLSGSMLNSQLFRMFKIIFEKENNIPKQICHNCKYLAVFLSTVIILLLDETNNKKQNFSQKTPTNFKYKYFKKEILFRNQHFPFQKGNFCF